MSLVFGLLDHPDWALVQLFVKALLGHAFQVHKACLNNLVPMTRSRVFLLLGPHVVELPQVKVELGIRARMLDHDDQVFYCQLTDEERDLLSRRELLPRSLRVLAPEYLLPRQLLHLRVVQGSLMRTLVASYRYQCYLNFDPYILADLDGMGLIITTQAAWLHSWISSTSQKSLSNMIWMEDMWQEQTTKNFRIPGILPFCIKATLSKTLSDLHALFTSLRYILAT